MNSSTVLYTPEVLALATSLSNYRLEEGFPLQSDARSRSCGSTLTLGLLLDEVGKVARVGLSSQACAIGQASAAIFAQGAVGRTSEEVAVTAQQIARWLAGEAEMPDWPGLSAIAAAQTYPGRHGALMLPWTAALQLLPTPTIES